MSDIVKALELPPIDDPTKPFVTKVKLHYTAKIIHTGVMAKPAAVSVVLRATGREAQMELIPVVFVHMDCLVGVDEGDDYQREREFVVLPPGVYWETAPFFGEYQLEHRGSFHYPQGAIFFLFEIVRPPAGGI